MQTSEAERIGVNQVAKVHATGNPTGTDQRKHMIHQTFATRIYVCIAALQQSVTCLLCQYVSVVLAVAAHLTAIQSALKMLTERIGLLYQHVQKMEAGKLFPVLQVYNLQF